MLATNTSHVFTLPPSFQLRDVLRDERADVLILIGIRLTLIVKLVSVDVWANIDAMGRILQVGIERCILCPAWRADHRIVIAGNHLRGARWAGGVDQAFEVTVDRLQYGERLSDDLVMRVRVFRITVGGLLADGFGSAAMNDREEQQVVATETLGHLPSLTAVESADARLIRDG
jgi:hypothetical protein